VALDGRPIVQDFGNGMTAEAVGDDRQPGGDASHALPNGWERMDYAEFLEQRRRLMASITRRGFETLT